MIWYSHLLKNFPQFVVIHTVKGFGIVNKTEVDVFLELSCFFNDPTDVGNFHQLSGCAFEQALGDGEGQGSLVCCSPWGHKESDTTERLNSNKYAEN